MATTPTQLSGDTAYCSQCGRNLPTQDLAKFGDNWVCADCKGIFAQKLREGAPIAQTMVYGGFWQRFAAIILDGLIGSVISVAIQGILALVMPRDPGDVASVRFSAATGLAFLFSVLAGVAYQVFFLTRSGATPGKMALGLKVVTADGGPISPGLAVGRYFAHWISSLTLGIGYIIAAFDGQKRALHDMICNTRVIRTR